MSYKLNLGSGDVRFDGFINVDLYDSTADIQADICDVPLPDSSVSEIKCIQVVEHVPYNKSEAMFKEMHRLLEAGGIAIIETPNIDVIAKRIVDTGEISDNTIYNLVGEYYRPWDKERYCDWEHNAASIHRNPWNFKRLKDVAEKCGFRAKLLKWEDSIYKCEENLHVKLWKD